MTDVELLSGLYGAPPQHLTNAPDSAQQLSPLYPGASDLGAAPPRSYSRIVLAAPAGTLERRYVLAQALTALAPGAELIAIAPKDKGGSRLRKELESLGCTVDETSKNHHRICVVQRPQALTGVDDAILAGAPRFLESIHLWSQPGVFSWDRVDPGSALLASRLPRFEGNGADLGCGVGVLSLNVLQSRAVARLTLVDIDRRAIAAAQRNVIDPRADIFWADVCSRDVSLSQLDFVVTNPPFHSAAAEDKSLGQGFVRNAAKMLRSGGVCWLVANRHLPYEAALAAAFKSVRVDSEADGFKIFEARK